MATSTTSGVTVLPGRAVTSLLTVIRDVTTQHEEYVRTSDRLLRLLAEEALASLPCLPPLTVHTPVVRADGTRVSYSGRTCLYAHTDATGTKVCVVSVMRSGDAMLSAFHDVAPSASVGKILIQRDDAHGCAPVLYYCKLPADVAKQQVILADPMLATGGSACMAIKELCARGVPESNILFVCVVSCPPGIQRLQREHPAVQIITAAVDEGLNEHNYIVPGLGDFGDRYFDTC